MTGQKSAWLKSSAGLAQATGAPEPAAMACSNGEQQWRAAMAVSMLTVQALQGGALKGIRGQLHIPGHTFLMGQ